MPNKRNPISDLKGAGSLTKDGVSGIIDIVEAIHYNITSLGGLLRKNKNERTTGITGFVYDNIRSITNLSGSGFDVLIDKLSLLLNEKEPAGNHEALVSVVNGVIGDHLVKKNNPLAIPMQLRYNGKSITSHDEIAPERRKKIVLMIHGSCMNDLQWSRRGHSHGAALLQDLNYTPVYLLYNSGRHVSENGKEFTEIIESFMLNVPDETELVILAHSMGGLVSRSAVYYGTMMKHGWVNNLQKLICLGTPHHGAPLEKGGNWIENILENNPFSAPISRLGRIRSAGITDLRYGNILDEDWNRHDRFQRSGDQRVPVPLPESVHCFAIAATMGNSNTKLDKELIGDGLVPLSSALGKHKISMRNLAFPRKNLWIGRNMKHLDLLSNPDVYTIIKHWLNAK